ncbi:MAG: efflux RND transporter periplasmic adaptor subunit [Planctomycetes bacterium]|nr:efflux RND transporter periplasmic adaptor subunit [Planctomycetota bacterium]
MNRIVTPLALLALAAAFTWVATGGKNPWAKPPAHGADWCEAHQVELSKCEVCNLKLRRGGTFTTPLREPKEGECPNTLVMVTLAPGAAEAVGLATHEVQARPVAETIRANAETAYVPTLWARVAPRIPGVIREVKVLLGDEVEAGAALAVMESTDFANAKSDYLQALAVLDLRQKTYDQEQSLFDKRISSGRDLLNAKTALEEARLASRRAEQALSGLGLSPERVKAVAESQDTSPLMEIPAPFAGAVVLAGAVVGQLVSPEAPVFEVANVERLWVSADVYEADLTRVEKGQKVVFTVEGLPGKRFTGRVVAIGGQVDDRTRTVPVHAEVKNTDGLLRGRMFGRAEISVKAAEPKMLVPKEAVQNDGDCSLVFLKTGAEKYQARKVELGVVYESGYEVTAGLVPGDVVVTTGAFLLKTEVMKGQMGAG